MALNVMVWVLEHSEARLAARLVLLTLAEYAHDDGSKAFPALKTMMRKARVKESTARGCLRELEAKGAIEHTGNTRGGVRIYRVLMTEQAAKLAGRTPSNSEGGSGSAGGASNPGGGGPGSGPNPSGSPSGTPKASPSSAKSAIPLEDAPLSYLLSELLAANGVPESKRKVTKAWADAERLMQERDGRDPAQMEALLRWGTSHHFWRANLLSMTGFREKYDQIRLQAERETAPQGGSGGARASADSDIERLDAIRKATEEQERQAEQP